MVKMSLVTVQRSPSGTGSHSTLSEEDVEHEESSKFEKSECFFTGKGTALILALREIPHHIAERRKSLDVEKCTGGGANLEIQQHLQSMFYLLRHEDTLKMAVKLESQRPNRTRYLAIISRRCYKNNNGLNISSGSRLLLSKKMKKSTYQSENEIQKDNNKYETSATAISSTVYTSITDYNKEYEQKIIDTTDITDTDNTTSSSLLIDSNDNNNKISTTKRNINCDIPIYESSSSSSSSSRTDPLDELEESCLLGIDCNEKTTIGLVLKVLADTTIRLDGDGGFSISVYGKTHIFKPVSVQAMWSALQTLHKVSHKARDNNFYPGGPSHEWVSDYESRIDSDRSCLNEWNTMDNLESRRPPSPDAIKNRPTKREETKQVIRMKLKEIMMSVDLDEVTSKYIRGRLEEHLKMDLGEFKSFIDEEMLMILGQMDAPTEIFEHVYLGSEWNASNLEELQRNGVGHILNVTREIDNFFPGMFDYFNVRVYDDEKTNLLKHWDNTYRYITRVKDEGSKVLVHCKMGVSRSASVVIAYAMKAYNWDFNYALKHVKERRNCVKPNKNFLAQLETYRGMLDAMQNKEKLQRSKSETNLKSTKDARLLPGSEPTPLIQALQKGGEETSSSSLVTAIVTSTGEEDERTTINLLAPASPSPSSRSLPSSTTLNIDKSTITAEPTTPTSTIKRSNSSLSSRNFDIDEISTSTVIQSSSLSSSSNPVMSKHQSLSLEDLVVTHCDNQKNNVRYPATNGQNYSLTQNQIRHLQQHEQQDEMNCSSSNSSDASCAKTIISELETHQTVDEGNASCSHINLMIPLSTPHILHQCDSINSSSNDVLLTSSPISSSSLSFTHGIHSTENNDSVTSTTTAATISMSSPSSSLTSNCENLIWTSSSQLIRQSTNIDLTAAAVATANLNQQIQQIVDMSEQQQQQQHQHKDIITTTTTMTTTTSTSTTATTNTTDYFSSQLDNIFENEETKTEECSNSSTSAKLNTISSSSSLSLSNQMWQTQTQNQTNLPPLPHFIDAATSVGGIVSRQSSCSSVDSAVFVGGYSAGEQTDIPSRQSSWGSGDNRILPSRNSSWGSYDTNRSATLSSAYRNSLKQLKGYGGGGGGGGTGEQVSSSTVVTSSRVGSGGGGEGIEVNLQGEKDNEPILSSTMGTVKRTKQKLEENSSLKKLCGGDDSLCQNISASSTSVSSAFPATIEALDTINTDNQKIRNKSSPSTKNRSNSEEIIFNRGTREYRETEDERQTGRIVGKGRSGNSGENIRKLEKLSASAPETFSIEKFAKVIHQQQQQQQQRQQQQQQQQQRQQQHHQQLHQHSKKKTTKQIKIENESHVQNLKKNFEAKASIASTISTTATTMSNFSKQKGHQSLPSSPIATHSGHHHHHHKDLNVKDLVTKYQNSEPLHNQRHTTAIGNRIRPRSFYESRTSSINNSSDLERTHSSTVTSTTKFIRNKKDAIQTAVAAITAAATNEQKQQQLQQQQQNRPPVPPINAKIPIHHHHHNHHQHHTSMTTTDGILSENFHQRKVQHYGKTHPLARLSFCKKKLNTAATYNTM